MSRQTGNDAPCEVARARAYLERRTWPRLQMSVIVLITAAAGFLASFLLLRGFDVATMMLRYPLAILAAYVVFLSLMWLWIRWRERIFDSLDVPTPSRGGGPDWGGAGGRSGGGGASGSWADGVDGSAALDVVDGDVALPLAGAVALVVIASVAVVATGWVIWSAPALMAELLVDAAIAGSLYRRMRREEAQGWWWLCMRHTSWPLLGVLAFFVALGGVLQHFVPEATTLMEALRGL